MQEEPFMSRKLVPALLVLGTLATLAVADLTPWKDYEVSDSVWSVTTIKVDANMDDAYLEGIKQTWVASNEVAKKLGQIQDYKILRSDLPQAGQFNLLLVVIYKNSADLAPSKARYEAFMKEWGEARNKETTEFAQKNYPAMREITGQYNMREVTIK
jgi:hypothetical protein